MENNCINYFVFLSGTTRYLLQISLYKIKSNYNLKADVAHKERLLFIIGNSVNKWMICVKESTKAPLESHHAYCIIQRKNHK